MRAVLALILIICCMPAAGAQRNDLGHWVAGNFSFSDELGGFRIVGISGRGTEQDPAIVTQEISGLHESTLIVRATQQLKPYVPSGSERSGFLFLKLVTLNHTGHPWIAFNLELQEKHQHPSVFGDGLSFDQLKYSVESFGSDIFNNHLAAFEPYDKLSFRGGSVNPAEAVTLSVLITDFTPRPRFYLRQDPVIPMF